MINVFIGIRKLYYNCKKGHSRLLDSIRISLVCTFLWGLGWASVWVEVAKKELKIEWQINYMANIAMKKLFVGEIKDMYTLVDI